MPPEKSADQITRMLAMMSYLNGKQTVGVQELAQHFGVTQRRIVRDIYTLWMTGLPGYYPDDLIDFSFDEEYVAVRESHGLGRTIPFTPREIMSLIGALECLAELDPNNEVIRDTQNVLAGLVAAEVQPPAPLPPFHDVLVQAASAGLGVQITYVSAEDDVTERRIYPQHVTTDGNRWYVNGWCGLARAPRTFRIDRIVSAEIVDETAPESRDAQIHQSDEITVVLTFTRNARWLAEEIPSATITDGVDSVTAEFSTIRTDWLIRTLLGVGEALIRVEPPELASALTDRAQRTLAAYDRWTA